MKSNRPKDERRSNRALCVLSARSHSQVSARISSVSSSSSMISKMRKLEAPLTLPQVRCTVAFRRGSLWRITRDSHETMEGRTREKPQISQGRSLQHSLGGENPKVRSILVTKKLESFQTNIQILVSLLEKSTFSRLNLDCFAQKLIKIKWAHNPESTFGFPILCLIFT